MFWLKPGIVALLPLEVQEEPSLSCLGGGNWISNSFFGMDQDSWLCFQRVPAGGGSRSWEKQGMDLIHGLSSAPGLPRMDQRIWLGGDNDQRRKSPRFPCGKGTPSPQRLTHGILKVGKNPSKVTTKPCPKASQLQAFGPLPGMVIPASSSA